jgi:hypothetical protein
MSLLSILSLQPLPLAILLLRLGVLSSPAGCPFFSDWVSCFFGWVSLLLRLNVRTQLSLSSLSRSLSCFYGWVSLLPRLGVLASPAGCPYSFVSLQPLLLLVVLLPRLGVLASPAGCPYSVVSLSLQPLLFAVQLLWLGQLSISNSPASLARCPCFSSGWVSLLSCFSPASSPVRCPASATGTLLTCFSPASSPSRCPASPAGCPYSVVSLQPLLLSLSCLLS